MMPLEDVRILAIEQYGAGPFGSLQLADLGADVIKIENPATGGDVGRYVPPFQEGEDSLFFESFNRNKRSLSLDLRNPAGRRVFGDLVGTADAVYSNLRGDVPAALGITYKDLAPFKESIVCVSLSGFGTRGPRAHLPAYDYILQGLTGWMSLTGDPEGPPTKSGLSLVDLSGGLVAALTMLAAIHAARRDGRGMDCDLSLYDTATAMLTYDAAWHLNDEWEPVRLGRSAHPSLVPFQLFRGDDGRWFVVACAKEKFWKRLTAALGVPEIADDARFLDFPARRGNREELIALLDNIFDTRPTSYWIKALEDAGVPVGPVRSVREALADDHTQERSLIVESPHERFGVLQTVRSPARVGGEPARVGRAPRRNEHAAAILDELGYTAAETESFTTSGAFG